jgi:hypothetical protein
MDVVDGDGVLKDASEGSPGQEGRKRIQIGMDSDVLGIGIPMT